jgi:hypothetical protein
MSRAEVVESFMQDVCDLDQPVADGENCVWVDVDDLRELAERYLGLKRERELPQVVLDVLTEVERAIAKFPTWPADPIHACQVFNEEGGELTKAVLQQMYEPDKNPAGAVRKEALQAAAMALRFLAGLDSYDWTPGKQVEQRSLAGTSGAHPAERAAGPEGWESYYSADEVDRVANGVYRRSKRAYDMLRFLAQRIRSATPTLAGKGSMCHHAIDANSTDGVRLLASYSAPKVGA